MLMNVCVIGLALSSMPVPASTLQCPYQVCYCAGPDINCDDRALSTIPYLLVRNNTFFQSLFLDSNLIRTVPSGSLPPNLREVSFENNPLTTIDIAAFDGSQNTLESLSFSGANCSKLFGAFGRLKSLKYLSISDSTVVEWNLDDMGNITATLQTLYLDKVGFKTWPTWLQHFTQLTELSVTTSLIKVIPDDALAQLWNKLELLTLNNNMLCEVPKTLSNMTSLRMLTLDNNNIVNVTWLPKTSPLTFLSLSSNSIVDGYTLSGLLKPYEGSLTRLGVSDNKLTYIPDLSFLTLISEFNFTGNHIFDSLSGTLSPAVKTIDLGHNFLSLIPRLYWSLDSVTDLMMPYNEITMTDDSYIPPWATALDLNFNLLTEITDTSFPEDSQLLFVHLNNNPIAAITDQAFVNLPRLVELDLQHTRLTRIPLALRSLKGIVMVDVSGTPDLVCTCLEKSLRQWILSQAPENMIGYCGVTSVYYFFQFLSGNCPE